MKRLTKEWVAKAEADFQVANTLIESRPPVHDARCFHCQQADFVVETRYPGENANKRQAEAAMRWATKVRVTVRLLLGLPT